jgi:hypothetical protein
VCAVLGVALVAGFKTGNTWQNGVGVALLVGGISTALLAGLIRLRASIPAGLAATAVLALVLDAWIANVSLYRIFEPLPKLAAEASVLARIPGVELDARVWDEFQLEYRPGSRLRIREGTGYGALPLARWKQVAERADAAPQLLAHFNVRWILGGPHHRRGFSGHVLRRPPTPAFDKRDKDLWEAARLAPAVYWVGQPRLVAAGTDVLAELAKLPPGQAAVVSLPDVGPAERATLETLRTVRPAVPGRLLALRSNTLRAEIDAPASGVVVVNEVYYPGWQARVDGRPTPLFQVNHLVRGLIVEPGRHTIELSFRPHGFRWCAALYLSGFAGVLAALVLELRRWRRRTRTRSASIGPA